jgi:hypothetical protein
VLVSVELICVSVSLPVRVRLLPVVPVIVVENEGTKIGVEKDMMLTLYEAPWALRDWRSALRRLLRAALSSRLLRKLAWSMRVVPWGTCAFVNCSW